MENLLSWPLWAGGRARVAAPRLSGRGASGRGPALLHRALPWLFPAALLGLWQVASARAWVAPQILPAPGVVLATLRTLVASGELWQHLRPSLVRVALGFGLAALLGLLGGALLGLSRRAGAVALPLLRAYAQVPVIAWMPLGILLLGIEERLLVALIASAALGPVLLNTYEGVRGVPTQLLEVARVYGYRGPRLLRRVVAPAALPPVFVGLRYGLSQAWLTLVAAELVGTTEGMGYLLVEARELFQLDVVLAAILVLGLTGVLLDGALSRIESRLLSWRPRSF
jgi:sulfonate transport system permease protein